ncbi:MAG: hypothetical protein Q3983_00455 [Capnocytophaga sp.]|nr:hypothetical protein [Capnocytophaga sp.]
MKKLVALLCLVSAVSFGQKNKTAWDSAKLKGKVKTYRILDYQFDEAGKPQRGSYEAFTEYDNTGKSQKMIIQNGDVYLSYSDTYDANGNLIESVSRDKENAVLSKNVYKYDEKGNRIKHDVLTADGIPFMSRENDYNDKGLITERRECMSGLCTDKVLFAYDKKGFVTEESRYNKDVLTSKIVYKNDKKGNRLEKIVYDKDGNIAQKVTTKYDTKNNEVEVNTYDKNGNLTQKKTNVYVYDKKQNWTKKTESVDGKPTMILEQQFEYFK